MTKKAQFILIPVVLIVVFTLGRASVKEKASPAEDGYREKYETLRQKIQEISEVDVEEYFALRDQKAKYQKADEILGKMLVVFLADLGLKLSPNKAQLIQQMAEGSTAQQDEARNTAPIMSQLAPSAGSVSRPVATDKAKEIVNLERNVDLISTESDAKEFLDSVAHEDLFPQLQSAKAITHEQLRAVNGSFAGKIMFDDKDQVPWDITLKLDGTIQGEKIKGEYETEIYNQGKRISRSKGKGDNMKDYQGFGGGSDAILVNVYGDDGFLQLYAPKRLGYLIGNYYSKKGLTSFKKTGSAILYPRNP